MGQQFMGMLAGVGQCHWREASVDILRAAHEAATNRVVVVLQPFSINQGATAQAIGVFGQALVAVKVDVAGGIKLAAAAAQIELA